MSSLFVKIYLTTKSLLSRDGGQGLSEYVMAVGLIALGCVAGMTAVATSVNHVFVSIATVIAGGIVH